MVKVWLVCDLRQILPPVVYYDKSNAELWIKGCSSPKYFYIVEVEKGAEK